MRSVILAGLAAALVSSTAFAQAAPPPPPAPPAPPEAMHEHHPHDPAKMAGMMQDHLRKGLQLRPDQEGALATFVEAMRPVPRPEKPRMDDAKPMTTPDMLEARLVEAREHLAVEEKRAAAVKAFYGALTPAQQKAFDEMHHHMGAMHGGMMDHGMMKGEAHKPMDGPAH